jgi:septal ring factor EnvC (AmiA/AmiB activator)
VYEEQRNECFRNIDSLNKLISIKQSQIINLSAQVADYRKLKATYEGELKTMREMRLIFERQITSLQKEIKRQKRKKKWATFVGLAAFAGITFLYITK